MKTVAKFNCESVTDFGFAKRVKLHAVYAPNGVNEEDRNFTKATPSGTIEMQIDNPNAAVQFEPNTRYYVTFEKVVE